MAKKTSSRKSKQQVSRHFSNSALEHLQLSNLSEIDHKSQLVPLLCGTSLLDCFWLVKPSRSPWPKFIRLIGVRPAVTSMDCFSRACHSSTRVSESDVATAWVVDAPIASVLIELWKKAISQCVVIFNGFSGALFNGCFSFNTRCFCAAFRFGFYVSSRLHCRWKCL